MKAHAMNISPCATVQAGFPDYLGSLLTSLVLLRRLQLAWTCLKALPLGVSCICSAPGGWKASCKHFSQSFLREWHCCCKKQVCTCGDLVSLWVRPLPQDILEDPRSNAPQALHTAGLPAHDTQCVHLLLGVTSERQAMDSLTDVTTQGSRGPYGDRFLGQTIDQHSSREQQPDNLTKGPSSV